jgi:hypothetical protein
MFAKAVGCLAPGKNLTIYTTRIGQLMKQTKNSGNHVAKNTSNGGLAKNSFALK